MSFNLSTAEFDVCHWCRTRIIFAPIANEWWHTKDGSNDCWFMPDTMWVILHKAEPDRTNPEKKILRYVQWVHRNKVLDPPSLGEWANVKF